MAAPAGIALAISVAIQVDPGASPDLAAAAVRSCEAALGAGQCRLGVTVPSDFYATVVASDDRLDAAHVEIRKRIGDAALATRDVSFAPEDAPKERWASAGVLIAALVVAEARAEPPPPPPEPVKPKEPPRPAPAPVETKGASLRIDLRAIASRRLTRGLPELGASLGASLLAGEGPWIAGVSLVGAQRPSEEPGIGWLSFAAGGGVRAGRRHAPLALELTGGAIIEYWRVSAARSGQSESEGRIRAGGFVGADFLWAVHRKWILCLGAEGRFVAPRLQIDISGSAAETVPGLGALVYAGVRFAP